MARAKSAPKDSSANLGFEAKLWLAADKLRNNMDAAEYKHVVLGLIFLKYISDSFDEHHAKLKAGKGEFKGANPEDKDEYLAANVFWVPKEARWAHLQANAKLPSIGKAVDDAMVALERDNPRLKGALNKNYGRADLDKHRLGELIDLIGSIQLADVASRSKDLLGRVFEYFLTQFASAEGKNGGQFYTPSCVVRLLVEMLAPYKGRIYDPACGSGGMFVQSEKFVESHGGQLGDISIYGQESNPTTRRLAIMNLALRGIEADFGPENADTFRRDLHPDLRADYVLANPPFNDSDWFRQDDDVRWQFGVPPKGNANFAWVQHFIHHLAPQGMAGFVLANGSMSSNQSGEGEIRQKLIEADLVDCMVALPGQLFYSTPIPVALWFLAKNKAGKNLRSRRRETLFIDARKMGTLVDRTHRELTDNELGKIVSTYHAWRGDIPEVAEETATRLSRHRLKSGDILFARRGVQATGLSAIVMPKQEGWLCGTGAILLRVTGKNIDPEFLSFFLSAEESVLWLKQHAVGAVMPNLNEGVIRQIPLTLPPLAEQKAIASVLGALDGKIELNRRMNATLEAMARALFQSWFVDFDPVRAKLDARPPAGLDPATATLFPDHLEDSPLGHIPKGWEARPLAEMVDVVKGRSYRSEELADSKTALVTLKSFLRGGGYRIDGLKPFTGEFKPNQRVRPGDLVVAFTDVTQAADVIGKPALIRSDERFDTLVASLDVGIVRPKSKHVSIPFLYCLFLTAEFQAHTYSHATGTTVLHLGSAAIPSFVSIIPPVEVAEKFAERADPIFRLIDENAKQSRTLATLRDTLLPKLLSGELSVAELQN